MLITSRRRVFMDENISNKDFENNQKGEISGFDSVNGNKTPNDSANENQGYTVTPDGGFYTKSRNDIIQDDISPNYGTAAEESTERHQNSEPHRSTEQNTGANFRHGGFTQNSTAGYNYGNANYYAKKPKKPRRRYGAGIVAAAALLAAVIGAVSGIAAIKITDVGSNNSAPPSGVTGSNVNINVDKTVESVVEAVAEKVTPSVIGIRTTSSVISFFGGSSEATGEGSGVIYTEDGYIITNYHVIESALSSNNSKIEVFLDSTSSNSYPAEVIGYNISSDLAVIKINAKGLTPAEIANSDDLKVGQYVITVGNPGGLEFMDSVTYGVISGLNRVVSSNSDVSLIQTDAAINPGNSGGALVNTNGQLVGINSSKIVSEEFEGMGFAIPVNTVVKVCDNIISKQNSPEPYVGITVSKKYTADVLKFYGYPSGAVVLSVADGSPAANAGIQRGDIITEFNGKEISEYTLFEQYLDECSPKDTVSLKIYRNGRYYSTNITIGSNNAQ